MEIFRIFGSVFLKSDEADNRLDRLNKKGKSAGAKFKALGGLALGAGTAVASGVAVASLAVVGLTNKLADTANEIIKWSQVTGHSTDEFQRWDSVMQSFGYSMEQANGDIVALGEKAMDSLQGVGDGAEFFAKLGVEVADAGGQLLSQQEIFQRTITALQEMENVTERNAIASALMSTTGEELIPVLNMTAEELKNMKDQANVIPLEDLERAEEYKKRIQRLQNKFTSFGLQIANAFMPIMEKLSSWFESTMPYIQSAVDVSVVAINQAFESVMPYVRQIVDYLQNDLIPMFTATEEETARAWGLINEIINEASEIIINDIMPRLNEAFQFFTNDIMPIMIDTWRELQPTMIDTMRNAWAIIKEVLKALLVAFDATFPTIKKIVVDVFEAIYTQYEKNQKLMNGIITFLKGVFLNDWSIAFEGIKKIILAYVDFVYDKFGGVINWLDQKVKWIINQAERIRSTVATVGSGLKGIGSNIVTKARNISGLSEGGHIMSSGSVLVGEVAPEIVELPRGATVRPLDKMASGINLTINNPLLLNDQNIDDLMGGVVDRLKVLGVTN